jgi:uncharacterized membrane protein YdbT with pleckstrin-like domain
MDLQAGEKILYEGHPSWRAILAFYLKGFVGALIVAVIAKIADGTGSAVLAFAVIGGLTVLAGFIKRVATTYTITDHRLNIKRGIVSRKVQETRLARVQNVNYNQSVFQRMLQVGDVDFDTAGTDDSGFVFAGVADPEDVKERVERATPGNLGLDGTPQAR